MPTELSSFLSKVDIQTTKLEECEMVHKKMLMESWNQITFVNLKLCQFHCGMENSTV